MGSKIFVNFAKYDFQECMRRLKEEINSVNIPEHKPSETKTTAHPTQNTKVIKQSIQTIDWTETDVNKWLSSKYINTIISENVKPCDGKILFQLYEMMNEAPEFFYSSITSNNTIPTREVAVFT